MEATINSIKLADSELDLDPSLYESDSDTISEPDLILEKKHPNSIVLFIKSHGDEIKESLVKNLEKKLNEYKITKDVSSILTNDVKLTLGLNIPFPSFIATIKNKVEMTNNPMVNLYNETELACINELIHFYCIDNPTHKITDRMYYQAKDIITYMHNEAWESYNPQYINNLLKKEKNGTITSMEKAFLKYKDSEKIVDVTMNSPSYYDRRIILKPNPGEREHRTYGIHIIKAVHNGNIFCSAYNSSMKRKFNEEDIYEAMRIYIKEEKLDPKLLNNFNNVILMFYKIAEKNPFEFIQKYNPYFQKPNDEYLLSDNNSYVSKLINRNILDYKLQIKIIDDLRLKDTTLSNIIAICKLLGFEKIYITDTSCRGNGLEPMKKSNKSIMNIPDDIPDIGDLVEFALPGESKWSPVLGKIINGYTIEVDTPSNGKLLYNNVTHVKDVIKMREWHIKGGKKRKITRKVNTKKSIKKNKYLNNKRKTYKIRRISKLNK